MFVLCKYRKCLEMLLQLQCSSIDIMRVTPALAPHLVLMGCTFSQFVHHCVSLTGWCFIATLNYRHDWLLIAGNLQTAGSDHKTISFQCPSNNVERSNRHVQLLGNLLLAAKRKSVAGRVRTKCLAKTQIHLGSQLVHCRNTKLVNITLTHVSFVIYFVHLLWGTLQYRYVVDCV